MRVEGVGFRIGGFGLRVRAHVLGYLPDVGGDQVELRADLVELRLHLRQEPVPRKREGLIDTDKFTVQNCPCTGQRGRC